MFLFHVVSQNGPSAFLGWVSDPSQSPDRSSTYRNSSESTRQHVTAEAIVGWEGFVARKINTLAFLVAPREGQSSLQARSHAGIHNTKYPAQPGPGAKKKKYNLIAQGTHSHVSPIRSGERIERLAFWCCATHKDAAEKSSRTRGGATYSNSSPEACSGAAMELL